MILIGCDFHPSWQQICWLDTATGETGERKLEHASGEAERFYRGLAGGPGDGCSLVLTWESWRVYQFSKSRRSRETRRVPRVRFGNLGLGVFDAFWAEALLRQSGSALVVIGGCLC
jgi:hypothetical protein